jgi:2,3-bisphosphoglycerate-dependent phosphoglycerate mutase
MQLYFIRHAQSVNNAHWGDEGYQESHDPELTKIAKSQVQYLTTYFSENQRLDETVDWNPKNRRGFGITHIYTSLMVRAVETALPVARAIDLPLVSWPDIHETGGIFSRLPGDEMAGLPGKPRSYFESHYPELILPDWLDEKGWWQSRPFETHEHRQPRAERVWKELLTRHADQDGQAEQRVALFSHGGFFMNLLTAALEIEMRRVKEFEHEYWFLMNNCGITRLDVTNGRVLVMYVNQTDFLADHLIT